MTKKTEPEFPAGGGGFADSFRPNYTNVTGGSTGGQPEAAEEPGGEQDNDAGAPEPAAAPAPTPDPEDAE